MVLIGITGPTGAGKTTLLREVEALGGAVIDCDAVYHELLEHDPILQHELERRFGPLRGENGSIDRKRLGAKTLFATHYHELTVLEGQIAGVKNYNIAAKKKKGEVIFLRKIVRGGADQSYGIEVAKLAGVPDRVVRRAREILEELENGSAPVGADVPIGPSSHDEQISLGDLGGQTVLNKLRMTDVNILSPIEALNLLAELKQDLNGG